MPPNGRGRTMQAMRRRTLIGLFVGALLMGAALATTASTDLRASAGARWRIRDLGTLGRTFVSSEAVDVSERGQIVGGSGTGSLGRAFLWENGRMSALGTLGGLESAAAAVNDAGQVIGGSLTRKPARGHAFLWQDGKMVDLGTLGGRRSSARAINNRGQVVGSSTTASGREHAFLWENGTMHDLGTLGGPTSIAMAINDRGQVVGSSENANGRQRAFLWHQGRMRDLGTLSPAYSAHCSAVDVNERGQVVGSCSSATISFGQLGPGVHAFLWQNGRMRDLGTLRRDPPTSAAVAINDRGAVIGNSPATGDWRAFLWRSGKLIGLGTIAGGDHVEAIAINNHGQVIGSGVPMGPHGMSHAFVWHNGVLTDLGTLGGSVSVPSAINEQGLIVGSSNTAAGKGHAVLWSPAR